MPTNKKASKSQQDSGILERVQVWIESDEGTERMKKAFAASDKLAATIQREAAQNVEPEVLSRSRSK